MKNNLISKPVARKKLVEECNLKQIEGKSLKTDIFKNNSQVKTLAPFMDIKAQSIMITPSQKLTQQELKLIIEACK